MPFRVVCSQGYVLADFPVTHAQSEKLFKPLPDPEAEEEAEEEEVDDELEDAPEGEEEEAEAEAEPAAEEEEGEEAEEVVPPKESRVPTPGYVMQIVAEVRTRRPAHMRMRSRTPPRRSRPAQTRQLAP